MSAARDELERRLCRKLTDAGIADAAQAARVVAECFWTVSDEWERNETTTLGTDGTTWLSSRFLVARWPVQGVRLEQVADRNVE